MNYYVNTEAQPTGEHEVHRQTCSYLPKPQNRKYLGSFSSCHAAVREARKHYNNVDGCAICSSNCHTK